VQAALQVLKRWMRRVEALKRVKEALAEKEKRQRRELTNARAVLCFCQRNCLLGLKEVYPIEDSRMIRGLPLDLSGDDEQLSASLGYVCHLTLMLSKYLLVSLRYQLKFHASRSLVCDAVLSADGGVLIYPLFRRDVERRRFEQALQLLEADVQQLMWSRGFVYRPWMPLLSHLHTLVDVEADKLTKRLMP